MTVKKLIPCSWYDIQGMQEWLDEMALQGLFFQGFSRRYDRAVFELGDPKPVRYRLDPVNKGVRKDKAREEPYAQMGWKFVTWVRGRFYIFSCDDPEAPELFSDPQSLAMAMGDVIRRSVVQTACLAGVFLLIALLPLLLGPDRLVKNLLLWEDAQDLVYFFLYPIFMAICLPMLAIEVKKLLDIRQTLAQGLPLKAKRRWNRPPFLMWYIPVYLLVFLGPRLFLPDVRWQIYDLDDVKPSHPWPALVQAERTDGYGTANDSWFAPIQEYISTDYYGPSSGSCWTGVRYVKARSAKYADAIFQVERRDAAKTLNNWKEWNGHAYHIEGSPELIRQNWPGLDRLETAQYRQRGRDAWTFAARRGNDILVVNCIGPARWEDCLPLFLEALDEEAAA